MASRGPAYFVWGIPELISSNFFLLLSTMKCHVRIYVMGRYGNFLWHDTKSKYIE